MLRAQFEGARDTAVRSCTESEGDASATTLEFAPRGARTLGRKKARQRNGTRTTARRANDPAPSKAGTPLPRLLVLSHPRQGDAV